MKSVGSIIVGQAARSGEKGTSVTNVVKYYLATSASSGVSISTSGWTTSIQIMTLTNKYLWTYDRTYLSDGTTSSTIPVISGIYGDSGYTYRPRGLYASGNEYVFNTEYRDVICYEFSGKKYAFRVRTQGISVTEAPTASSGDSNWEAANELVFVATDLLLSRKISADEIDVEDLTVKNVEAKDASGKKTCSINGETGDVDITGNLTLESMRLSKIPNGGSLKDGYLIISSNGHYIAPTLSGDEVVEIRFITPAATRVPITLTLIPENSSVRIGTTIWLLDATNSSRSIEGIGSILGFVENGLTYWIVSNDG
ncbi:MAG: hypothetical protein WCS17_11975 [Prevotella sp.]